MLLKHPSVQIPDSTVQVQTPSPTVPASQTPPSTPSITPLAPSSTVLAGLPSNIYLATRVELPKTLDLSKAVPLQPVSTLPTSLPQAPASTSADSKGGSEESKGVEQQKKTVEATSETPQTPPAPSTVPPTAPSSQVYILPVMQPVPTEGRRDQPQPEATPSVMMPLGGVAREIEVTTKGMEIQVGSTLLMYYDWVRSRGYERSLSEFINQTVEAYFTEKGLMLGITLRRD